MAKSLRLGQVNFALSTACKVYWPCMQANTDTTIYDRSGNGNVGTKGSGQTYDAVTGTYGLWGTANRVRSYSGNDNRCPTIPRAAFSNWDASQGQSLIVFWRGEMTLPGSATALFECGSSGSTPGIRVRVAASGVVDGFCRDSSATLATIPVSTAALAGTVQESVAMVIDGVGKTAKLYVNGVTDTATIGLSSLSYLTSGSPSVMTIGGQSGSGLSLAMTMAEFHVYVCTQPLPSNIAALISHLHNSIYSPLKRGVLS